MIERYKTLYLAGYKTGTAPLQTIWKQLTLEERKEIIVWLFVRALPDVILASHVMRGEPKVWN